MVDRERIEHVFDNLIMNAIQHTGRGAARYAWGPSPTARTRRFVVRDTGEGIPAEHVARIFEKFYRVPSTRHTGGAGLGLAIVREIVTAHGGQIEVEQSARQGNHLYVHVAGDRCTNETTSFEMTKPWTQKNAS